MCRRPILPWHRGIYDIARISTHHPERYLRQEFRIDPRLPAGSLTEKMALPWQADFADCRESWWPSQRPVAVTTKSGKRNQWSRGIDNPKPDTKIGNGELLVTSGLHRPRRRNGHLP